MRLAVQCTGVKLKAWGPDPAQHILFCVAWKQIICIDLMFLAGIPKLQIILTFKKCPDSKTSISSISCVNCFGWTEPWWRFWPNTNDMQYVTIIFLLGFSHNISPMWHVTNCVLQPCCDGCAGKRCTEKHTAFFGTNVPHCLKCIQLKCFIY